MSVNQVDVDITDDQLRIDETRLITTNRVSVPPHHIAVFYSKPTTDVYIDPNTTCSIRQNDLLTLECPEILVLETLHSFDPMNMSNSIVIFPYNCDDLDLIIPKNMTVAYMKESKLHMVDLSQAITMPLIKQSCINTMQEQLSLEPNSNENGANINTSTKENNPEPLNTLPSNLSENEIRQIAEQSAFVHPSAFHPKPRLTLEDTYRTPQTKQALDKLLIDFDDIMSHSSTDIGLVTLKEVLIETPPDALPIASKLYPLALKHHQFVKEELQKLLQAGLIEWSMSPYASLVLVVNKKSQHPLAELPDV